jgi:hypothetical protein
LWRPEVFSVQFSPRHLFSPVIPLFNWENVIANGWELPPIMWAIVGLMSYMWMMRMSSGVARKPETLTTLSIAPEGNARDGHSG